MFSKTTLLPFALALLASASCTPDVPNRTGTAWPYGVSPSSLDWQPKAALQTDKRKGAPISDVGCRCDPGSRRCLCCQVSVTDVPIPKAKPLKPEGLNRL